MQKYNTQLQQIKLPEYGRNIQQLIQYCKTIPDREKRTRYAYSIVEIMSDIYPDIKNVEDGKRILWDHIAVISDFELDIDYPYPVIRKQDLQSKPNTIRQNPVRIKYKMYGSTVEQMLKQTDTLKTAEERKRLFEMCANHMKRNFHNVNTNADEDNAKIINDLIAYAGQQYAKEIKSIHLMDITKLQKNSQYDPAKLAVVVKKKKKKKK